MGVTQNFSGFLAVRFFLGVAESGLFPGVVFYLSMWYKRAEQHYRVALFFSAASLAGAFGGILAWGIAHMRGVGGYNGWRWIFILEGLLTVVISVAAYFLVHNYPATSTFLTEEEKEFVIRRLENDSDAIRDEKFTWAGVIQALKDPKVYLYGLGFHTMSLPLYTLSLFLVSLFTEAYCILSNTLLAHYYQITRLHCCTSSAYDSSALRHCYKRNYSCCCPF